MVKPPIPRTPYLHFTPLHLACALGTVECARLLVDRASDRALGTLSALQMSRELNRTQRLRKRRTEADEQGGDTSEPGDSTTAPSAAAAQSATIPFPYQVALQYEHADCLAAVVAHAAVGMSRCHLPGSLVGAWLRL